MIDQKYLKTREAARYLGITESELRRYARISLIPYSRPGGKMMLFAKDDLDQFITKHRGA